MRQPCTQIWRTRASQCVQHWQTDPALHTLPCTEVHWLQATVTICDINPAMLEEGRDRAEGLPGMQQCHMQALSRLSWQG